LKKELAMVREAFYTYLNNEAVWVYLLAILKLTETYFREEKKVQANQIELKYHNNLLSIEENHPRCLKMKLQLLKTLRLSLEGNKKNHNRINVQTSDQLTDEVMNLSICQDNTRDNNLDTDQYNKEDNNQDKSQEDQKAKELSVIEILNIADPDRIALYREILEENNDI
jgi:hypothetical protein